MAMPDWLGFFSDDGPIDKSEEQMQQFADYLAVITLLRLDTTVSTREELEAIYEKCPEIARVIRGEIEDMLLCP